MSDICVYLCKPLYKQTWHLYITVSLSVTDVKGNWLVRRYTAKKYSPFSTFKRNLIKKKYKKHRNCDVFLLQNNHKRFFLPTITSLFPVAKFLHIFIRQISKTSCQITSYLFASLDTIALWWTQNKKTKQIRRQRYGPAEKVFGIQK